MKMGGSEVVPETPRKRGRKRVKMVNTMKEDS
jgi:hypothetical protein